jgi:hypothetical protein
MLTGARRVKMGFRVFGWSSKSLEQIAKTFAVGRSVLP